MSLKLERVEIPDEGTYKCYASIKEGSSHEAHIKLKVDAPVLKVDIQQAENKTTCSSEGIYPEPQLTWSIDPPPNETLHNKTTVHQTEQKLYNISSSLNVKVTDVTYNCTVSTGRNKMAATLFKQTSLNGSSKETTMRCTSSKSPPTGLIWRFNHSQIIIEHSQGNVSNLIYIVIAIAIAVAVGILLVYCIMKKVCCSEDPGESGEPEELTDMNKNEDEQ
ncbi:hypothetical protein CesoFtcFv8_025455 [Champsocephalus esox]|uniref:Ig-like domain-containing protein n=1 Tax=Champsocephalus esox TaxID=159716 RepID=A0AAN8GCQ1_9TELE|nr:hypothetical protein CesoFtcFv8_025455 [Champsocephalus esox]